MLPTQRALRSRGAWSRRSRRWVSPPRRSGSRSWHRAPDPWAPSP